MEINTPTLLSQSDTQIKTYFAKGLSQALSNEEQIREFVREEALKTFDGDYDVPYSLVKNKVLPSGKTFEQVLSPYFKEVSLKDIERSLPLLTIFVPTLPENSFSAASVEPVDLNFDGLFSNNILLEANQIDNRERFYLELESVRYDWEPVFYDQRMFLWSPLPNVFTSSEGVYLRTEYGYTALLAKYQFDPMKNKVDVLGNLGGGSVDSVIRMHSDTLKINYRQFFFTSNGWEELSLISLYKKI